MSQYLCLFSLILQGLHRDGEWRQLGFWARKGANIRDLFYTTPKVLKLHESQFWNILKILGEESTRGGHPLSMRVEDAPYPLGAPPASWAPWQASGAHLWLYEVFGRGKNKEEAFGTKRRRLEVEPWRNQSRAPAELFCRGNIPLGGGNHHHQSSHRKGVNLHQHLHQHHLLSNHSSSLYPIFVSKHQIGTCALLVVLITPCSWC